MSTAVLHPGSGLAARSVGEGLAVVEGASGAPHFGTVFDSEAFHLLHAPDSERRAYLRLHRRGEPVANVHFSEVADGLWRAPARGTFGGVAWGPELTVDELDAFLAGAETVLRERGATRLEMAPRTMSHDPQRYAQLAFVLHRRGWTTSSLLLDQSLPVGSDLRSRMSKGNQQRARRAERAGLVAGPLPASRLHDVYEVLEANTTAKGRSLSITYEGLQEMATAFPGVVQLFGCSRRGALVAAAVCLHVDPSVTTVFLWGSLPEEARWSPVLLLAEALHEACADRGVRLLDIGTSPADNPSLLDFKRRIGCEYSLKATLVKEVSA